MRIWALALGLAVWSGPAAAACTVSDAGRMVSLRKSIEGWQVEKSIGLTMPFTQKLQADLCNTVVSLVAEGRASREKAEEAAPRAAIEYLNDYVSETVLRSPGAILRSLLGVTGLSRPVPRPFVPVTFRFTHELDTLIIGSESMIPRPKYLLTPGMKLYAGFLRGSRQCGGRLMVSFTQSSEGRC